MTTKSARNENNEEWAELKRKKEIEDLDSISSAHPPKFRHAAYIPKLLSLPANFEEHIQGCVTT